MCIMRMLKIEYLIYLLYNLRLLYKMNNIDEIALLISDISEINKVKKNNVEKKDIMILKHRIKSLKYVIHCVINNKKINYTKSRYDNIYNLVIYHDDNNYITEIPLSVEYEIILKIIEYYKNKTKDETINFCKFILTKICELRGEIKNNEDKNLEELIKKYNMLTYDLYN